MKGHIMVWEKISGPQREQLIVIDPLKAAIGRPFIDQKLSAARARELFKLSMDSASLLVEIKKNVFRFDVFWRWRHNEGMFSNFWPPLPGLWPQPIDSFFWLKFFSETRQKSASLEPLNGFLAYL